MRIIVAVLCLLGVFTTHAQTRERWEQVVNWDGVSHWSKYMITQPAYQGPNSLPVPRLNNGTADSNSYIAATGNFHFSRGDNTQNLTLYGNYCLIKDLISFDVMWIPYEHYNMSTAIKEKRHVYYEFFNDNSTGGDIHINTNLQLLNKWRKHIHLVFRFGARLPSGSDYGAARYTDGPGYNFDLSFGKPFGNSGLKWTGMLGFYVWQIRSDYYNQNDAFLFGSGLEFNKNNFRVQSYVAGYLGYIHGGGDKEIVFRATLEKRIKQIGLLLGFQHGLKDLDYTSGEIGIKYNFKGAPKQFVRQKK